MFRNAESKFGRTPIGSFKAVEALDLAVRLNYDQVYWQETDGLDKGRQAKPHIHY
jgi:hypothetical protein